MVYTTGSGRPQLQALPQRQRASIRKRALAAAGCLALTLLLLAAFGAGPSGAAPRDYIVDAESTSLRVIVLRRGALSPLAHDHVLSAKGITGSIVFDPVVPATTTGELHVPVASIEVDDPKERAKEKVAGDLNDDNRASVRQNMLGADQLAAATFPRIDVTLEHTEGIMPSLRVRVRVRVRQKDQTVTVPLTVTQDSGSLTVRGETDLLQSVFGIEPYSTLFGAIAVEDSVHVRFEIVARATRP